MKQLQGAAARKPSWNVKRKKQKLLPAGRSPLAISWLAKKKCMNTERLVRLHNRLIPVLLVLQAVPVPLAVLPKRLAGVKKPLDGRHSRLQRELLPRHVHLADNPLAHSAPPVLAHSGLPDRLMVHSVPLVNLLEQNVLLLRLLLQKPPDGMPLPDNLPVQKENSRLHAEMRQPIHSSYQLHLLKAGRVLHSRSVPPELVHNVLHSRSVLPDLVHSDRSRRIIHAA